MQPERVELKIGSKTLFMETGVMARQAGGSVVIGLEETIILSAACASDTPREGIDFLPLTVDYRNKTASAGRVPGGFFKREGRPSTRETLTSRLVDRTIRPMFANGYANETQVMIYPLSFDYENETDNLAITGASAALAISSIAFHTPVSGGRIGRVNGEFIFNPTLEEKAESDIDLLLAGTEASLVMVEGGGKEISEADLVKAMEFGHESLPGFANGYANETQVMIYPLSFDYENETDNLAITGASAALAISSIAFHTPVSGGRIGRVNGEFIFNPTLEEKAESDIDLLLAGTEASLVMVEGGGKEISEADLVKAMEFGHEWIKKICRMQAELVSKVGKPKMEIPAQEEGPEVEQMRGKVEGTLKQAVMTEGKHARSAAIKQVRDNAIAELMGDTEDEDKKEAYKQAFGKVQKQFVRRMILDEGVRADGRATNQIREINIAVDALPRTHGSALFTRGETQALVTTTLGAGKDELIVDDLEGKSVKTFMLHYNFPPFCSTSGTSG